MPGPMLPCLSPFIPGLAATLPKGEGGTLPGPMVGLVRMPPRGMSGLAIPFKPPPPTCLPIPGLSHTCRKMNR